MQSSRSHKTGQPSSGKPHPEMIWKEIRELIAVELQDNPTQMLGEMQMRAAGDPSMLLLKLGRLEPSKAVQLIKERNLGIDLNDPHNATPQEKQKIVSAVLDLFSATT